jgi:hypothetical protein
MNKKEINHQTKLAFDFIQKLYFEVSYLIKEIEGLFAEEDERFIIGRTGGYQIVSRNSAGLESSNVSIWPLRKLSVFFVPEERTKISGGTTKTLFDEQLRIIHLRVVLDEKEIVEPYIKMGVFYDFQVLRDSRLGKLENLMGHLEYNEKKTYKREETVDYEDSYIKFSGKLVHVNLFDINSSEDIVNLLLAPILKIYREV